MHTIVGSCPHCGAPIYSPTVWMGVTPPPAIPSCNCVPHNTHVTTAHTGYVDNNEVQITYTPGKC